MDRSGNFHEAAAERLRAGLRKSTEGMSPDDAAFVRAAVSKANIKDTSRGVRVGGGPGGPIDEADANTIKRTYRVADRAENAGHNVHLYGTTPRGIHVFPHGAAHDTYESAHIIAAPLREGGWSFNHYPAENGPRAHSEIMPGLYDDEVPGTVGDLSRRWF